MATVGLDVFRQPLGKQFRIGIEVGIQTLIRQESLHGAGVYCPDIGGSILEYGCDVGMGHRVHRALWTNVGKVFDPLGVVRFGPGRNLLGYYRRRRCDGKAGEDQCGEGFHIFCSYQKRLVFGCPTAPPDLNAQTPTAMPPPQLTERARF